MKICGIYKIQNKQNGKVYIGRSNNILVRWQQHFEEGLNKTLFEDEFHFELAHYPDHFEYDILELCEENELDMKEEYWINIFNSIELGYNKIQAATINKINKRRTALSQKQITDKINSLIGKPLTKKDKDSLCDFFNFKDRNGRQKKWPSIKKMIINNGLAVIETKRKNSDGQIVNCSIISVDWK